MSNRISGRVSELFLFDIFVAIQKIKYTTVKFENGESLLHDFISWDSVIREFEIIGEATNRLIEKGLLPDEYRVVVDFRNRIAHGYFGIEPELVWLIATQDLSPFEKTIRYLIGQIDDRLKSELIDAYQNDNQYLDFLIEALEKLK